MAGPISDRFESYGALEQKRELLISASRRSMQSSGAPKSQNDRSGEKTLMWGRRNGSGSGERIDIRPGVSMLSVLKHLNYKPWYALAEFVDNALQSYLANQKAGSTETAEPLIVDIDVDFGPPGRISIKDNAAGIAYSDFPRAFRTASAPPDRTGLAEFGIGMKSAACWFAPQWSVRTSTFGDPIARTIKFDIDDIVSESIEELVVEESKAAKGAHFTEVILDNLFHTPQGRTLSKIKEHLTDIYRDYIRKEILILRLKGEVLSYEPPEILFAAYFKTPDQEHLLWRKDIKFDLGSGQRVTGFAAIRSVASTKKAGFALFRRGRIIQGSGDDGYRPEYIFGGPNTYRYQRLFGELHLDGFEVSHTKDGFRWDDTEQPFLELLREHLEKDDLPMFSQADGYRVRKQDTAIRKDAQSAATSTTQALGKSFPSMVSRLSNSPNVEVTPDFSATQPALANRKILVNFRGQSWEIDVQLTNDPAESQWLALDMKETNDGAKREIGIRLSLAHPFMVRYAQDDFRSIDAFLRLAAGIAIAEVLARSSGVRNAATIRRNLNEILMTELSGPQM
jgi:hypothetical protein